MTNFPDSEREVTAEEWKQAERAAGFRTKGGGDGFATGGFSGNGISGRIDYMEEEEVKAETIIPEQKIFGTDIDDLGIEHEPWRVCLAVYETQRSADLWSGQGATDPGPLFQVLEGLFEIVGHEAGSRCFRARHVFTTCAEDRVAKLPYSVDSHAFASAPI